MAAPKENVSKMSTDKKYRIEVTVVTGFEEVAKEEAEEKLNTTVDAKTGRIGFELPLEDVKKVLELGSANHCMVVMKHIRDFQFSDNEHDNLRQIRSLAGELDWPSGLKVWSQFFSFEHPIQDTPDVIPTDYGEVTMLANVSKSTESRAKKIKKKIKQRRNKFKKEKKVMGAEGDDKAKELEVKDGSDLVNDADDHMKKESEDNKDIIKDSNDCPPKEGDFLSQTEKITSIDNITENLSEDNNKIMKDSLCKDVDLPSQTQEATNTDGTSETDKTTNDSQEDTEEPQPKKQRTSQNPWNPLMPSFRVTCNRTGEGHNFNSMNAAANLGGGVYNYFGWNVKMTGMDIEVIMNIVNQEITLGIGFTRQALHKGNIKEFGCTTLRPSICYGLLRLCDIQPGDIVCDPMCGVGSISIQGGMHWPNSFHFGADIIGNATKRGRANFDFVNQERQEQDKLTLPTDILRWDACTMPLRNQSVDVFVSDVPFGVRMGSKSDNWRLYSESLYEMARCSKPLQSRACLLTEDKNCMIKTLQKVAKYWNRVKTLTINVGGLSAGVYLLHRSATTFEHKANDGKKS